ncbi:hypothetical protein CEXT_320381 [Caerostris extrusa]|uniref:Uncharacterized protein n=1 Tax=Caerostris extrusa TaxID=172846 RepID=A0AAV4RHL0_CAEEX|nr:hypothetical protein CEXT_320381 [Caerostris extrusa]
MLYINWLNPTQLHYIDTSYTVLVAAIDISDNITEHKHSTVVFTAPNCDVFVLWSQISDHKTVTDLNDVLVKEVNVIISKITIGNSSLSSDVKGILWNSCETKDEKIIRCIKFTPCIKFDILYRPGSKNATTDVHFLEQLQQIILLKDF